MFARGVDIAAYLIYTSGSSGRPKGTWIEHRGLVNLAEAQIHAFGVGAESTVLQFATPGFDASISEIAMALGAGGTLHLAPREALTPGPPLLRRLREERISVVTLPPSALAVMSLDDLPALRSVIFAGESPAPDVLAQAAAPGRRVCLECLRPPFWARRVEQLGTGPAGIPREELTARRLAQAIEVALGDEEMRRRRRILSEKIGAEDGIARAVEILGRHLGPQK